MEPMITVLLKENNFVRTVFEKGRVKEKRWLPNWPAEWILEQNKYKILYI